MNVISRTDFDGLKLFRRGKVRDVYDLGDFLLVVATDRISAFDVVMPDPIPRKGEVLNQISSFWFRKTANLLPNHLLTTQVQEYPEECKRYSAELELRSMLVKKTRALPIECIVRGYLSGSGWTEYCQNQSICGISLPAGLKESQRLSEPIFTPSTKAEEGHDQSMLFSDVETTIGKALANKIRGYALSVYQFAHELALSKGIIIADTKMEFGLLNEVPVLIDELLTPDSSRFWPADQYEPGRKQMSYDKQFLRDYLLSLDWEKKPPGPRLPDHIIRQTSEKYLEALKLFSE